MKFGMRLPSNCWPKAPDAARALGSYGAASEDAGFSDLWVIEHLLVAPAIYGTAWLDPMLVLANVAATTSTVGLGTAIMVLPLREPVLVAKEIATLDALSGGRFVFGVGVGWDEAEFASVRVPHAERGPRTDESLALIRRLLTEDGVTHDGPFYPVRNVTIDPRPDRMPPVWIAGGTLNHAPDAPDKPYMPRSVARRILEADAWMSRSSGSDTAAVKADWAYIQDYLREYGRDPATLTFAHTQFVHISEKPDHEACLAEQGPHFSVVMGGGRSFEDLAASYLMGTIDEISARIADLRAAGLEYILLTPVTPDPAQIDLLRRHVLEVFGSAPAAAVAPPARPRSEPPPAARGEDTR